MNINNRELTKEEENFWDKYTKNVEILLADVKNNPERQLQALTGLEEVPDTYVILAGLISYIGNLNDVFLNEVVTQLEEIIKDSKERNKTFDALEAYLLQIQKNIDKTIEEKIKSMKEKGEI